MWEGWEGLLLLLLLWEVLLLLLLWEVRLWWYAMSEEGWRV